MPKELIHPQIESFGHCNECDRDFAYVVVNGAYWVYGFTMTYDNAKKKTSHVCKRCYDRKLFTHGEYWRKKEEPLPF